MGKTYMMILLLLFVVNYVSGIEDQVFLIPGSGDIIIDTTAVMDAIVGVGIDYESIHRSNSTHIAIHVFGKTLVAEGPDENGKITLSPLDEPAGPPGAPTGCSAGFFSAVPNFLIGLLMIMVCSGRYKTTMLILALLVVFGYVSSIASVKIIIYIPAHSNLDSLIVNALVIPMVSPEVADTNSNVKVQCQVKGSGVTCGSQICSYDLVNGDTNSCLIDNAEYVGVLLPLGGPLGPVIKDSIEHFVNHDGFSLPYLQYIVCDSKADPPTALKFVDELYAKHNVSVYIGPLSSDECTVIMNKYDSDIVVISPAATATSLQNPNTFISLSMSNEEYTAALNMIVENDFSNTLENIIVIYRDDIYGNDLINIIPLYFEAEIHTFPYASDLSDLASVVTAAGQVDTNNTAVIVIAYNEVADILTNADNTLLAEYPWYAVGLSFNPLLTTGTAYEVAKKVQFKTLEFRGSNIEAHTADRTDFYEKFCAKYGRPLAASAALGYDAALLIANTPLIFDTTPYQAYFLLVEEGDVTFGLSGWLTLSNTGYRSNGDFISQLVVSSSDDNPLGDSWLELGYVALDLHRIYGEVYYQITFRVVSNYVVPGNWSTEHDCQGQADLLLFARNIKRQYALLNLEPQDQDISIPLYDTLLISYLCSNITMTQVCPSALFGSDTQCSIEYEAIGPEKRFTGEVMAAPTQRQVCTNAGSTKGCLNGGAPGACEKSNSTCAAAAFKDGCTKAPPFCKK